MNRQFLPPALSGGNYNRKSMGNRRIKVNFMCC